MKLVTAPNSNDTAARWEFLDSLRAIAALVVMLDHWLQAYISHDAPLWHYFSFGGSGVALFFLVSGFIIPVSLEKYGSLRTFWIGRFFRLFPLYLFSIGLAFTVRHSGLSHLHTESAPIWKAIVGNGLMAQQLFHVPYPIAVYWSLSFEVVFYIGCSTLFLFGVLSKSRLWSIASSTAFLLATLAAGLGLHRGLSAEKAGVVVTAFFGTVFYRYAIGRESRRGVLTSGIFFAATIALCFWVRLVQFPKPSDALFPGAGYIAMVNAWAAATGVFVTFFALKRFQFPRVLLWIGRISYSIYLIHSLVLESCKDRIGILASVPVFIISTFILATLTFYGIEKPFQHLQHRLFPKKAILNAPPSTTVAVM